jgi:hypothetical protein
MSTTKEKREKKETKKRSERAPQIGPRTEQFDSAQYSTAYTRFSFLTTSF